MFLIILFSVVVVVTVAVITVNVVIVAVVVVVVVEGAFVVNSIRQIIYICSTLHKYIR